jgi:hypothetical protein
MSSCLVPSFWSKELGFWIGEMFRSLGNLADIDTVMGNPAHSAELKMYLAF